MSDRTTALLERLAKKYPEERAAVKRLGTVLRASSAVYDAKDLYDAICPGTRRGFMALIYELASTGALATHVIVRLPGGEVLGRYESITDVPDALPGPGGEPIRMRVEYVHVKYTPAPPSTVWCETGGAW